MDAPDFEHFSEGSSKALVSVAVSAWVTSENACVCICAGHVY